MKYLAEYSKVEYLFTCMFLLCISWSKKMPCFYKNFRFFLGDSRCSQGLFWSHLPIYYIYKYFNFSSTIFYCPHLICSLPWITTTSGFGPPSTLARPTLSIFKPYSLNYAQPKLLSSKKFYCTRKLISLSVLCLSEFSVNFIFV